MPGAGRPFLEKQATKRKSGCWCPFWEVGEDWGVQTGQSAEHVVGVDGGVSYYWCPSASCRKNVF